jgi:hypothetical protein
MTTVIRSLMGKGVDGEVATIGPPLTDDGVSGLIELGNHVEEMNLDVAWDEFVGSEDDDRLDFEVGIVEIVSNTRNEMDGAGMVR